MVEHQKRIRNRTNDTPYKLMSDPETRTYFDLRLVRSGKKYYVEGYEPFKAKYYRVSEDSDEIIEEVDEYRYYKIIDSSRKTIGKITMYTPLERAYSLINRHDFPDHMDKSEFIAFVHYSGRKPTVGTIDTRQPYVTIPPAVVVYNDILVDDAVNVCIERKDGVSCDAVYHVSRMKDNLIVGLSPFKWLYVDGDDVKEYLMGKKKDERLNDTWLNSDHFLKDGVPVKVRLIPLPKAQCMDLSVEAVRIMRGREVKD